MSVLYWSVSWSLARAIHGHPLQRIMNVGQQTVRFLTVLPYVLRLEGTTRKLQDMNAGRGTRRAGVRRRLSTDFHSRMIPLYAKSSVHYNLQIAACHALYICCSYILLYRKFDIE